MQDVPRPPHVLVLPLPAQGHIAPMLTFSHLLAARGVVVTFLNTQKAHTRILMALEEEEKTPGGGLQEKKSSGIRFEAIPDGSQEPLPGVQPSFHMNSAMNILKGMEAQQGVIEEMVVSSRATAHPITCIVADSSFHPWTCSLAKKLGIQRVIFWTSNGAFLAAAWELKSGKFKFPGTSDDDGEITAGLPIAQSEFFSKLPQEPELLKFLVERMKGLEDITCIVAHTFQELEGPSLEACALCGSKVHHIGPLVPLGNRKGDSSVSFYEQESSCIEWLDKQATRSVLYVSFGSVAMLAPNVLEELAFGVEESKQAFLWVFRNSHQSLPEGFLDRTCDRGLLVKWAPQANVLEHDAVGAFLTHCGWNSILESIDTGVSLLCYPLMHDQLLNALLVTKIWKLGISLSKDMQEGVVTREEIKRGISSIFSAEEAHANSARWKGLAHSTLQEGGSSYRALEQFVEALRSGV